MMTEMHAPGDIRLLGALLDDMPEAALLARAVTKAVHVVHEPSRLAVLARLRGGDFDVVVFPVVDAHGLPTAPRVEPAATPGDYVVKGMKFSMTGWWVFKVGVTAVDGQADQVTFNIIL